VQGSQPVGGERPRAAPHPLEFINPSDQWENSRGDMD
jgi:hypothetical protein